MVEMLNKNSYAVVDTPEYAAGKQAGQRWASRCCDEQDVADLMGIVGVKVQALDAVGLDDWAVFFQQGPNDAYCAGERLVKLARNDDSLDRSDMAAFWEEVGLDEDEDYTDHAFARGFADGCVEFVMTTLTPA